MKEMRRGWWKMKSSLSLASAGGCSERENDEAKTTPETFLIYIAKSLKDLRERLEGKEERVWQRGERERRD